MRQKHFFLHPARIFGGMPIFQVKFWIPSHFCCLSLLSGATCGLSFYGSDDSGIKKYERRRQEKWEN
jgi:hypothetical protein